MDRTEYRKAADATENIKARGLRSRNYALVVPVVLAIMMMMIVGGIGIVMSVMVGMMGVAIVMMVVPMMIMAVPSCRWSRAADRNCADNT